MSVLHRDGKVSLLCVGEAHVEHLIAIFGAPHYDELSCKRWACTDAAEGNVSG